MQRFVRFEFFSPIVKFCIQWSFVTGKQQVENKNNFRWIALLATYRRLFKE